MDKLDKTLQLCKKSVIQVNILGVQYLYLASKTLRYFWDNPPAYIARCDFFLISRFSVLIAPDYRRQEAGKQVRVVHTILYKRAS